MHLYRNDNSYFFFCVYFLNYKGSRGFSATGELLGVQNRILATKCVWTDVVHNDIVQRSITDLNTLQNMYKTMF